MAKFLEMTTGALTEAQVDEEGLILKNVTLLGRVSKNGRIYSEQAMNDAVKLYSNAPYFVNHPTKAEMKENFGVRRVQDLAGKVVNPRRDGDMVRGDVHLLPNVPATTQILAIAKTMPEQAGNSHRVDARVLKSKSGGPETVEGLNRVFGMELVTAPATTSGLYESEDDPPIDEGESIMDLNELKEKHPDIYKAAVQEGKDTADDASKIAALEAERDEEKKRADDLEATDKLRVKTESIQKKVDDAKLPEELVTETFLESLNNAADDATVDALIKDRQEMAKNIKLKAKPKHKQPASDIDQTIEADQEDVSEIDDDKIGKFAEAMFA